MPQQYFQTQKELTIKHLGSNIFIEFSLQPETALLVFVATKTRSISFTEHIDSKR
jgi:hypothetical protein